MNRETFAEWLSRQPDAAPAYGSNDICNSCPLAVCFDATVGAHYWEPKRRNDDPLRELPKWAYEFRHLLDKTKTPTMADAKNIMANNIW